MSTETKTVKVLPAVEDISLADTVFHLTPLKNAESILEAGPGLHPNPERGREESWRRLEVFMDDIRPEHIRSMGISRRNGVFAYPDLEVLKARYLGPGDYERFKDLNRKANDDTAFAIDVDPNKVWYSICMIWKVSQAGLTKILRKLLREQ